MNMVGMNSTAGGPVGGGMIMMMNNGNPSTAAGSSSHTDLKRRLDTYIYDYFLKNGHHELARAIHRDESIKLNILSHIKPSPSRRRDGEMNGIDDSAMDGDSKDDVNKIPDDLPIPDVPDNVQSGFLYDWFGLFSDIYGASRSKKPDDSSAAAQYLQQTQMMQRMRETQHSSNVLGRQAMIPSRQFGPPTMRNGMTQDMQRAMASAKMSPAHMQHLQQQKQQQQQHQLIQQMQREHSENEMNGHRPQSPASTENAGSPSKRPRLEGQQFPGGPMAPNGRGQGGPQQQQQAMNMLMANSMNGRNLSQAQFQSFQAQNPAMQKNLQVYAQNLAQQQGRSMMNQGVSMPNGMMNTGVMPNQGSPMLGPVEAQNYMPGMSMDSLYNSPQHLAALRQQATMQGGNGQGGNHALQDYQMQLMLLEQQNKKRLMMARQEQDSMNRTDGGQPIPGQPGMPPSGMSPGSRAGASPNPHDQMKRGNQQMGANGMPSSPSAGENMPQARGSPAGMSFGGGMQQDFNSPLFMKSMGEGMVATGGGMRPPTSMNSNMNMEAIARQQQGPRMPSGNWQGNSQGQPMMQQPSPAQPPAIGTPQQRAGEMPPPSAPATGPGPNQRNQAPSPQPPTPSQSNKANPKTKKDKNEPKKRPNKKNSTANAPTASDADHPATPNPSTPITANAPAPFAKGPNAPASGAAPTSHPTPTSNPSGPPPQQPQASAVDPTTGAQAFTDYNASSEPFNLDFSSLETADVLENFDFDTFLHTDEGGNSFAFDPTMNFPEGLETNVLE